MRSKGYSRRDFLQFCGYAAMVAGISKADLDAVAQAFEKKPRPPVVWLHFQECTCCSESFIRSSHPIVADVLLDLISLDYTETLQAAAGFQAEKCLHDTIKNVRRQVHPAGRGLGAGQGRRRLLLHRRQDGGETSCRRPPRMRQRSIAWGSCASNGCIQAASPNPTGATPIHKLISKPVINVPGCPPIADVMAGVVTHLLVLGRGPELDNLGRPRGVLLAARARHLLPARLLRRRPVRRDLGRREGAQGLLPLQDGLPRARDLQRLLGDQVERRRQLSDPVGPRLHRLQRGRFLGQRALLPAPGRRSRASASRARPTRLARPWASARSPAWPPTPSPPTSASAS